MSNLTLVFDVAEVGVINYFVTDILDDNQSTPVFGSVFDSVRGRCCNNIISEFLDSLNFVCTPHDVIETTSFQICGLWRAHGC